MITRKAQRGYLIKSRTVERSPEGFYKTIIKRKEGPAGRSESIREKRTGLGRRKRVPRTSEWMNKVEDNAPPSEGMPVSKNGGKTPAWQRKEGKNPKGGLNAKGVASYRRANPGSKLKTAVTTKPSKLKPGSKSANRRKSFCARMSGMKKRLTSAKTANDPNSRINKSLRKWNC